MVFAYQGSHNVLWGWFASPESRMFCFYRLARIKYKSHHGSCLSRIASSRPWSSISKTSCEFVLVLCSLLVWCLANNFDAFMEFHRFTWFEVHGVLLRQASKFGSSLARVGSAWLVQSMQHGCYSKFLNESCWHMFVDGFLFLSPLLKHWLRFHPSQELLSFVSSALLAGHDQGILQIKNLGHFSPDKNIL